MEPQLGDLLDSFQNSLYSRMSKTYSENGSLAPAWMGKRRCLKRKKDASGAQEPCYSVGEWFGPTQPYCFSPMPKARLRESGSV